MEKYYILAKLGFRVLGPDSPCLEPGYSGVQSIRGSNPDYPGQAPETLTHPKPKISPWDLNEIESTGS